MSKQPYVIFLGAGASAELGIPTMVELSNKFEESLLDQSEKLTILRTAKQLVSQNGFDYDVESLHSYLDGSLRPIESMKDAGPFPASMSRVQPITDLGKAGDAESQLLKYLEDYIVTSCMLKEEYKRRVVPVFNRLLSRTSGIPNWKSSDSAPDWTNSEFNVFTTNYDNVLEYYGEVIGKPPFRGYTVMQSDRVRFTPDQYDLTDDSIKLHKLHGSIELSLLSDETVSIDEPPKKIGERHAGEEILSKVMVYGPHKNIISEPYFELLLRLKMKLKVARECIVIGYSFRDPWIRQVFSDAALFRRQLTPWIHFVSPTSSTIKPRLPFGGSIQDVPKTLGEYLELPREES